MQPTVSDRSAVGVIVGQASMTCILSSYTLCLSWLSYLSCMVINLHPSRITSCVPETSAWSWQYLEKKRLTSDGCYA